MTKHLLQTTGPEASQSRITRLVCALLCLSALALASQTVLAQSTGVSDDRVSLPEGPGSLEGVGENVGMNPNMGSMTHAVSIAIPAGFAGATPDVGLSYNSGGGASVVGMGWSMPMPTIERMTYRGLPKYSGDDDFSAGNGDQLVRVPGTNPAVYRARYEKGFVRYIWMDEGQGSEGYWIAEYPDGSKGYFGADAQGETVDEARVGGSEGTFKYHMVEKIDVFGHAVRYTYSKTQEMAYLTNISYVFGDNQTPTYRIDFDYEARADDTGQNFVSDGAPGFELLMTQRLKEIAVHNNGTRIRHYEMSYAPYGQTGGFTQLVQVETFGLGGQERYPAVHGFEYSQALGNEDAPRPFMVDMGDLQLGFGTGQATLLDINGDALPDILDTSQDGAHKFFINEARLDGTSAFNPTPVLSQLGSRASHNLRTPGVQVLDINGDGFTDIINAANADVLLNQGNGDWEEASALAGVSELASALADDFDAEDGDFRSLRFIDFDNDKKIDVMRSTQFVTAFFKNEGAAGFSTVENGDNIGAGFEEDNLELADMNGDGLLDAVKLQLGVLSYRLNLGRGKWADWQDITGLPITDQAELALTALEDINGDALADLVLVQSGAVTYALNQNGASFSNTVSLINDDLTGLIPVRESNTQVLYADMNANGSSDIVWIQPGGKVEYLELFPVRPNLITRITNNLGMVTSIEYATSAVMMAQDGGVEQWRYRLPYPMQVVASIKKSDLLTNLTEITEVTYHDGFYDGVEKQFRGFERVEMRLLSDESQEEGLTQIRFDVGATDPYFNGLELASKTTSAGRELSELRNTYEDCPVHTLGGAALPQDTELPIRHICQTASETILKEGKAASEWAITQDRMVYDGFGNVLRTESLGVTRIGNGACAPCDRGEDVFGAACGPQCTGDESFTETEFVTPGANTNGRWLLGMAFREKHSGATGAALASEVLTYYDGNAFEGLPLGNLDKALVSRVTVKKEVDSDAVITVTRNAFDTHGNIVDTLDPLGSPDAQTHRRQYTYESDGLRPIRAEVLLEDKDGQPYTLRRDVEFEELFDKPIRTTAWMRVVDNRVVSTERATSFAYDTFGRMIARFEPGNTSDQPNTTIEYDLQSPASRIITRSRSKVDGPLDLETINCIDGRNRTFQTRTKLDDDRHQVTGMSLYNVRSAPVEIFQPYVANGPNSDQCDTAPPIGTLSTTFRYDSQHRPLETTAPDATIYGSASVSKTLYEPLAVISMDAEDNDPASPHAGTPTIHRMDGMGRVVAIERLLEADGQPAVVTNHFDGLGRTIGYTDPEGHKKEQSFDLLGRALRIIDPNSADATTFEYDDASNIVRKTDDRGVVTVHEYDGMNRKVATFDAADEANTRIEWTFDFDADCDASKCTNNEGRIASISYPGIDGQRASDMTGFDLRGRAVYGAREFGGHTFEFATSYDNANRPIAMTFPNGEVIEHRHDAGSRLTQIPGLIDAVSYDGRSMVNTMDCADGTTTTIDYDDLMRLQALTVGTPTGALQQLTFERDRAGNVVTIADGAPAAAGRPSFEAAYTYDAWYRLIKADIGQRGDRAETLNMGFDALDNIKSKTSDDAASLASVGSYSYDSFAPNALTDVPGVSFDYDKNGNVEARGDQRYTWDFMNRMTAADKDGQAIGRYIYGSNQRRIAKIEHGSTALYISPTFEVRDGISSLYVKVAGGRAVRIESDALATDLLTDLAVDGQINAADAWLAHKNDAGSAPESLRWSSVRRLMVETGPDDGITFLHRDHLGSLTLATGTVDGEHAVMGHRAFYPMGQERPDGSGYVDEYGFTGQEIDRATGLVHFDWRSFDPTVGRWMSIDPYFALATAGNIGNLGESTTAYAYVGGNVINAVDPTGLKGRSIKSFFKNLFGGKKALKGSKKLGKSKSVYGKYGKLEMSTGANLKGKLGKTSKASASVHVLGIHGKVQKNNKGFYGTGDVQFLTAEASAGLSKKQVGVTASADVVAATGGIGYQNENGKGMGIEFSGGLGISIPTVNYKKVGMDKVVEVNIGLFDASMKLKRHRGPKSIGFKRTHSLSLSQ